MLYADENSFDIGAKITKTKPVLLPIGAVEAHGPHLPLGTDNILASEYSAKIAAETDGFVLPVLPYGQVWSLQDFPGSLTLSNETVTKVVVEIGESTYFRKHILMHSFVQPGKSASSNYLPETKLPLKKLSIIVYPPTSRPSNL